MIKKRFYVYVQLFIHEDRPLNISQFLKNYIQSFFEISFRLKLLIMHVPKIFFLRISCYSEVYINYGI
jgi:hypothetical protein